MAFVTLPAMEKRRLELKVGLFVFIGLALLGALLIQFSKGASIFRGTYELRLDAVTAGSLKPRAPVSLAGVQIGSVSDIQLAPSSTNVIILLEIYKSVKIYHDARFVIEQSGFLGDEYVSVEPTQNQPPVLQNGATVECEPPFNLQETVRSATGFIQRIDETAKKLDVSVSELQQAVLNGQTLTNLSVAIENFRAFSQQAVSAASDINALIATNGSQVGFAVSNIVLFSQDLNTNDETISAALKNIESATETLTNLMSGLQSGRGLAGTVLQDQQLATNVQAIANNLSIATSNLNRLGLWGFLWHKQSPPGAPEANQPTPAQSPHGASQSP